MKMCPLRIGSLSAVTSFGFIAAAMCAPDLAQAAELTVHVDPKNVVEGESVQLRIETEIPLATVVFDPEFNAPDFTRLGASAQGMSLSYSGNDPSQAQKTVYYTYVLSPNRTGRLTISGIRMRTNKGMLQAADQTVVVTPDTGGGGQRGQQRAQPRGGQNPRNPFPGLPPGFPIPPNFPGLPPGFFDDEEDPFAPPSAQDEDESTNPAAPGYGGSGSGGLSNPSPPGAGRLGQLDSRDHPSRLNSDFTVHASLSKRRAYVGEPIVVEYSLYDYGGLRQVEVQKWPVFTGFWKEDLEIATRFDFEEVYLQNRVARRAFLGRYAIYGIKPGKYNLDKLTIRGRYVEVSVGGFGFGQRTGVHSSQDEVLEILPLPKEDKPAKFSGAVGKFAIKLDADKTTVAQNTPVVFSVVLSGAGNFQSIESVKVPLPPDFEIYESNTGARGVAPLGVRRELETTKTFTYTAIPRKAGKFTVEPITWSYFDPVSEKYVELKTEPMEITVVENAAGGDQANNSYLQPGGGGGAGGAPGAEIRGLKPLSGGERALDLSLWLRLLAGALGVLNIYLLYRFVETRAGKYLGSFLEDAFEPAKNELSDAKAAKGAEWLGHVENALLAGMEVLLGSNPRGLPRAEVHALWTERELPEGLFARISGVLDRLDQQRFAAGHGKDAARARTEMLAEAGKCLGEMGGVRRDKRS